MLERVEPCPNRITLVLVKFREIHKGVDDLFIGWKVMVDARRPQGHATPMQDHTLGLRVHSRYSIRVSLLDHNQIRGVLQRLADTHSGDWLLVGGGAVALWLSARRTTQDIDIVPFIAAPEARYALYGVAHDLGFPVEVVNSAADFFVHRIDDWRTMTVELLRGQLGTIWRPTATLLILLKLGRMSERDLEDCLAAVLGAPDELDHPRILSAVESADGNTRDVVARRETLARAVEAVGR